MPNPERIRHWWSFVAPAIVGAALGAALHTASVIAVRVADRPGIDAARVFASLPPQARMELRSEWMGIQVARAFRNPALIETGVWQDYRTILFPAENRLLVCAPDDGPVPTGFTYWGLSGLKTAMPRDPSVSFEVLLLCSVRI
jgi:hypothetical protein